MPKTPNYPVPALEKGLDIVETLAAAAVPQSLAELADALDRSSSELFRMLNCLERRGYVKRDGSSGKYALTLRLYTLAHAHSVMEKLLRAATGPMQALTEKTRESCHLSVLEDDKLVVVSQHESPERVRLSIEVGSVFDPVRTASGRLLLAQLPADEVAMTVAATKGGRELSLKDRAELNVALTAIRRRGISIAESETIEGVRDLAVLVGRSDAGVSAALAVTRLMRRGQRVDDAPLILALQKTASEITKALGLVAA